MANLQHVAPALLGAVAPGIRILEKTPAPAPASPSAPASPEHPQLQEVEPTPVDRMVRFSCDAEVFVRPVKSTDGKSLPYEPIIAKNSELEWNPNHTDMDKLVAAFAKACVSQQGKEMEALILAAAQSKRYSPTLSIYISSTKGFLKGSKVLLTQQNLTNALEIMSLNPNKRAGIMFSMENPSKVKVNVAKAELTERATAQAARKLKRAKKTGGDTLGSQEDYDSKSESGNSADDPESTYMNRLFAKHQMNMDYDHYEPVVINPADATRYFLLTHTKARTWAQMRDVAGIDIMSPPPSIKYDLVKKSGSGTGRDGSGAASSPLDSQNVANLVVSVIAGLEAHRDSRAQKASTSASALRDFPETDRTPPPKRCRTSEIRQPSSSPLYTVDVSSTYGLENFLTKCGCSPEQAEEYKSKFVKGGIADVRLINEVETPLPKMLAMGFSELVARMMYKNAGKCARKLARERMERQM